MKTGYKREIEGKESQEMASIEQSEADTLSVKER